MDKIVKRAVIIAAGGSGVRMGGPIPKQFRIVGGEPILARTINLFAKTFPGIKIVVVLPENDLPYWKNLSARFSVGKHSVTIGGKTRFHSVKAGLEFLDGEYDLIAVQDAVRPLATPEMLNRTFECALINGSAIPCIPPVDSFREENNGENRIISRDNLRAIQTPQVFRSEWIRDAYWQPFRESYTDDASVVESAGYKITLSEGERSNIKITTREDLFYAEAILKMYQEDSERDI